MCEKSDGVRVLVMIVSSEQGQEVYLVRPPSLLVVRAKRAGAD